MKFKSIFPALRSGVALFPAELLVGAVLGVAAIAGDNNYDENIFPFVPWVLLLSIATFCVNRWTRDHGLWRIAYWTMPLVALAVAIWPPHTSALTTIMAAALLLIVPGIRTADDYRRATWNSALWVLIGFGIGLLVMVLAILVLISIHLLFGANIDMVLYWLFVAVFYLLVPLLCCTAISRRLTHETGTMTRVVADYILAPFSMLYTVVLFFYVARILFLQELPQGGVAYMVSGYVALSLVGGMLHRQGENRVAEVYYRIQPFLALLPIGLLWVGAVRRVLDYGWTDDRICLVAMSVLLSVADVAAAMRRLQRHYRAYLVLLAAVCGVLTFAPWINAHNLGVRAQQARLQQVLPAVVDPATGKFYTSFDYEALSQNRTRADSMICADEALNYLRWQMDTADFNKAYAQYGTLNFSKWNLRHEPSDTAEVAMVLDASFYYLNHAVDLGPYTQFQPEANWHLNSKEGISVELNGQRVVSYPIVSRANSLRQAYGEVCPDSVLIYRTDRYMLVVEKLDIYNSSNNFYCSGVTLYSRP